MQKRLRRPLPRILPLFWRLKGILVFSYNQLLENQDYIKATNDTRKFTEKSRNITKFMGEIYK